MDSEFIAALSIILGVAIVLLIYFIPTIVAFKKDQLNKTSVFILNLFLGWSLIGWVVALVWATKKEQNIQVVNNNYVSSANDSANPK